VGGTGRPFNRGCEHSGGGGRRFANARLGNEYYPKSTL
jgi:hypothetical protein